MADYTSEIVNPTLIENTTMTLNYKDGVATTYYITPNESYVLHDNRYDDVIVDEETGDEIVVLGYRTSTASCRATYDFETNEREFYAVPENTVPADQIFGVTTPTETM